MLDEVRDRTPSAVHKRKIILIGYPRFARPLERMLSDRLWEFRYAEDGAAMRLPFADALYQVGGHLVPDKLLGLARVFGRKIVKHWIGTDAESAGLPAVAAQSRSGIISHWADSPWIAEELRASGLNASVVTLNYVPDVEAPAMPPGPLRVLVYLPSAMHDFYNAALMTRLAARLPRARFAVVGGTMLPEGAPANMELLGVRDDMTKIYGQVHALVRMPRRDGMSFMVTEALAQGRYIIWNRPMEHVEFADNEDAAVSLLKTLEADAASPEGLPLNKAGSEYARAQFGSRAVTQRLRLEFERILNAGGS